MGCIWDMQVRSIHESKWTVGLNIRVVCHHVSAVCWLEAPRQPASKITPTIVLKNIFLIKPSRCLNLYVQCIQQQISHFRGILCKFYVLKGKSFSKYSEK